MTQRNGGQHAGQHTGRSTGRRLTVAQAADALGVTVDAIRSRIKRGTIAHVRDGERVYVVLGADQGAPSTDQGNDQVGAQYGQRRGGDDRHARGRDGSDGGDHRDELVEELRNRVRYLEEESRRKDHLLAAALERIPALEATREPPQAPETAAEGPDRSESRPATGGAQEAARHPWWRRLLRG